MSAGRGTRRRIAATIASLALVLAGFALVPVGAAALDADLKHTYAFQVEASNGYSITALASSEHVDGRGEIVLYVVSRGGGVIYRAPATLSATRIDADLGPLGRVALDVSPSGRQVRLKEPCRGEGEPDSIRYEPWRFRGSFEFHGEEGFAEAAADAPSDHTGLFYFVCTSSSGIAGGQGLTGAMLRVPRAGLGRPGLQVNKDRRGARTRLEASIREERGEIKIERFFAAYAGTGAFRYDSSLTTATIHPPAPFSGYGSFHRNAAAVNRWSGDLAIDFPGRSNMRLTGPGLHASLIPAELLR